MTDRTVNVAPSRTVFIGSGAGFAGDRFDAALPVVATLKNHSGPKYLIYEVMGERTLAIAQQLKRENPGQGYSPWLDRYLPQVLEQCVAHGIRIVANFGNANPQAAATRTHEIAAGLGIGHLRVAIVEGDDLLAYTEPGRLSKYPAIEGTDTDGRELHAANAYLGAQPVAQALSHDPHIVLVGRTTDAALVLGPLIHEFQWRTDDYSLLAAGTMAGHLLECGGQVSGGYFADPGYKDVDNLHELGFPIAEITADGDVVITKADHTGGRVDRATVTEQLLYEMHDPGEYLTPDVTLDISACEVQQIATDRVRVSGAIGRPPPATLKVTLSVDGGWLGEAEISYAGLNALPRAQLAAHTVRKRIALLGMNEPCRVEIIGTGSVHDDDTSSKAGDLNAAASGEYRVRAAVRSASKANAQQLADEILALYCCGPAAGGGVRQSVTAQVSTASILVERDWVEAHTSTRLVME